MGGVCPKNGLGWEGSFLQRRICEERFWESLNGLGWLSIKKEGLNQYEEGVWVPQREL